MTLLPGLAQVVNLVGWPKLVNILHLSLISQLLHDLTGLCVWISAYLCPNIMHAFLLTFEADAAVSWHAFVLTSLP